MEYLEHHFQNVNFTTFMKAQFRKYFDKAYSNGVVVEMKRRVYDKDNIEIIRIHMRYYYITTYYFIEKIYIDRKNQLYQSTINTSFYKEICKIMPKEDGINYSQEYSVPFFLKSQKKDVFFKGCEVIKRILSSDITA